MCRALSLLFIVHHTSNATSLIQEFKGLINLRKGQFVGDVVIQVNVLHHHQTSGKRTEEH